MKLMIRAHDLGVKGEEKIVNRLHELALDGVQLVCYKSMDDISYQEGSITKQRAQEIASAMKSGNKEIGLLGAYFNPVHPDLKKVDLGIQIFKEYIALASEFGACAVGSETGSYQGEPWIDHPMNHTDEALERVICVFKELAQYAQKYNVIVGMEGACAHVCSSIERLYEAVERIDCENIQIIFDLYSFLNQENVHDAIGVLKKGLETFKDRILLFHLKDYVLVDGKIKQCGVGKGLMDYEKILEIIYQYDSEAVLILEGTDGDDLIPAVNMLHELMKKIKSSSLEGE